MRKTGYALILVLTAVLLIVGVAPVWILEVRDRKSGEIFLRERVTPGDRFRFSYIHSVERTPVEGTFLMEKDGLFRIVETRFSSHGTGLPNIGEKTFLKDGWFITEEGPRQDRLTFLFSSLNRPVFKFKDKEIALRSKKGEEGLLEFSTKKKALTSYALEELYRLLFHP